MDDKIIYSWCFNYVEYFDLTSFVAIIVLIKTLESLSSLRSQQLGIKEFEILILAVGLILV